MEPRSKSRGSGFRASRRPTKQWNEMNTAARSTCDMFSNSAAGRFTTVVTPSDTKEWQKNCGPSEQMSRSFPLTDERLNGAFRAIYSGAKRPSWQKTWRPNWSYRAISKCSNSIAPRRTNSSTNAGSWDSPSGYYAAAKNGPASATSCDSTQPVNRYGDLRLLRRDPGTIDAQTGYSRKQIHCFPACPSLPLINCCTSSTTINNRSAFGVFARSTSACCCSLHDFGEAVDLSR